MNFFDELENFDKEVFDACSLELDRQRHNIELIGSENIVSKAVLLAAGTVLTNKYAEGFPVSVTMEDASALTLLRILHAREQRSSSALSMQTFSLTAVHLLTSQCSSLFLSQAIP